MLEPADLTFRIGHGYDLHRLEPVAPEGAGRPFILGGVRFDHPLGPVGHSDGDALYHALTDALLGAIGAEDIGRLFPDTDPQYENADSAVFVEVAAHRMRQAGYAVGNVDITVICERPRLGGRREKMIANVARLLQCDPTQVNIKGKTHEQVGTLGEGRAVEVHAVALLAPRRTAG
ncbi:MAG: 2-C-methyl-D-erythritol 2,4-cyclodiphosphate synthase [Phycisphaerales bacterium]|nr:MAG: 2-C-methyl-D-erythritol 2,4-cyclodiphosphate synthase [Phycisphaerales bacterium]